MTAEFHLTRMSIGRQLATALTHLGWTWVHVDGGYRVAGRVFTPGELADRILDGGFRAAFGRATAVIREDVYPLRAATALRQCFWEHGVDATHIATKPNPLAPGTTRRVMLCPTHARDYEADGWTIVPGLDPA